MTQSIGSYHPSVSIPQDDGLVRPRTATGAFRNSMMQQSIDRLIATRGSVAERLNAECVLRSIPEGGDSACGAGSSMNTSVVTDTGASAPSESLLTEILYFDELLSSILVVLSCISL